MIDGVVYNYDYRFGEAVNNLISFLINANLRYRKKGSSDVGFKGFKNIKLFEERLESIYKNAINEINENLLIDYKKYDRLTYVSNLIIKISEVKGLFSEEPKIGLKHIFFKLHISSKFKKKEIAYQEYCVIINDYLSRFLLYLNEKKELHSNLGDLDLPKEELNDSEKYASTQEDPIYFFKRLVKESGFGSIYERFKPTKEDFQRYDIEYCDETKTITYNVFDTQNGTYKVIKKNFSKYLQMILGLESNKTMLLIEQQFQTLQDQSQFVFYLRRVLEQIKKISEKIEIDNLNSSYIIIQSSLKALIKNIKSQYKNFLLAPDKKQQNNYFFNFKGKPHEVEQKLEDLFNSLVKNEYINKDCKKDFKKLFKGVQPLNKILWLGNKNELILFVNLLIDKKLIEKRNYGKWLITAECFKFSDGNITSNDLKNTKPPKLSTKIHEIISKV